jgi:hypothetical protein
MDELERYIRENREDLDRYEPGPENWKRINSSIRKTGTYFRRAISVAAVLIILTGIAAILTLYNRGRNELPISGSQKTELSETERFYNSMINELYSEAKPLLTKQPEIEMELNSDLARIDSICADIKKDLRDNISNKDVIEALILNYRIKLQILEEMLQVLKENENEIKKPGSHEL